jgi:NADH-quinone oxidoreductase subunit I
MNNSDTTEQSANKPGTVLSPKDVQHGFIGGIFAGLLSLVQGMWVTLTYFLRPSTVVTRQYPENRDTLKMYDRFRALLEMPHDQDGYHNCTACGICETACPNASINVITGKDAAGKKILKNYVWRLDACTFCNACVQACPFSALAMTGKFESAVYDRRLLTYSLNRYSGPPANALKKVADLEERKKMMEPCLPYSAETQAVEPVSSSGGK